MRPTRSSRSKQKKGNAILEKKVPTLPLIAPEDLNTQQLSPFKISQRSSSRKYEEQKMHIRLPNSRDLQNLVQCGDRLGGGGGRITRGRSSKSSQKPATMTSQDPTYTADNVLIESSQPQIDMKDLMRELNPSQPTAVAKPKQKMAVKPQNQRLAKQADKVKSQASAGGGPLIYDEGNLLGNSGFASPTKNQSKSPARSIKAVERVTSYVDTATLENKLNQKYDLSKSVKANQRMVPATQAHAAAVRPKKMTGKRKKSTLDQHSLDDFQEFEQNTDNFFAPNQQKQQTQQQQVIASPQSKQAPTSRQEERQTMGRPKRKLADVKMEDEVNEECSPAKPEKRRRVNTVPNTGFTQMKQQSATKHKEAHQQQQSASSKRQVSNRSRKDVTSILKPSSNSGGVGGVRSSFSGGNTKNKLQATSFAYRSQPAQASHGIVAMTKMGTKVHLGDRKMTIAPQQLLQSQDNQSIRGGFGGADSSNTGDELFQRRPNGGDGALRLEDSQTLLGREDDGRDRTPVSLVAQLQQQHLKIREMQQREVGTIPDSFILAKCLFKVNQYGVKYIFAEIISAQTTVSSEKNLTAMVQKIKPTIRVMQAFAPEMPLWSERSTQLRHSGNSNRSSYNSGVATLVADSITAKSVEIKDGDMIMIGSPTYTEIAYGSASAEAEAGGADFNLESILASTGNKLTVISTRVQVADRNLLDKLELQIKKEVKISSDNDSGGVDQPEDAEMNED